MFTTGLLFKTKIGSFIEQEDLIKLHITTLYKALKPLCCIFKVYGPAHNCTNF